MDARGVTASQISASYSFAAAQRAYGVASPARPADANAPTIAKIGDAVASGNAAARVQRGTDSVAVETRASAQTDAISDRLVAATVPGRIDFSQDQPVQNTSGVLPFYRHPADKNSAATRIAVGTRVDMNG